MEKEIKNNKVSNDTVTDDVIKHAMERAIELSINNAKNRTGGPFGSVVVRNGKIISEGSNMVTTWNDSTAHAEIVAIRKACQELKTHDLSGCVLFTSCFCCSMCFSASRWSRINKIYYANTREDAAKIGFSDVDIYEEIKHMMNGGETPNIIQIKNENAIKAFQIWDADKNKIEY